MCLARTERSCLDGHHDVTHSKSGFCLLELRSEARCGKFVHLIDVLEMKFPPSKQAGASRMYLASGSFAARLSMYCCVPLDKADGQSKSSIHLVSPVLPTSFLYGSARLPLTMAVGFSVGDMFAVAEFVYGVKCKIMGVANYLLAHPTQAA